MLDIVISHYNEPWEVGEKMFDILNIQRGIDFNDFRVLLVHDGTEPFPEETFSRFKYKIDQLVIPHGGISAARNAGIDNGDSEWLMFCDFDDTFAGIYSLRDILTLLGTKDHDVLWGHLVAEDFTDGHNIIYYTPNKQIWVFTHAKVYRRQYLIDSGIRFNESLIFNEDSEFNAHIIARLPHQRIGEIQTKHPLYVWIRRPSSVTQSGRDDEAHYGHFKRNLMVTEENRQYREPQCYAGMVTRTVWDTWFMAQHPKISKAMKQRMMNEFVPWIKERFDVFLKVSPDDLRQIRAISRYELVEPDEIARDEPELVFAWVKKIIERGEQ